MPRQWPLLPPWLAVSFPTRGWSLKSAEWPFSLSGYPLRKLAVEEAGLPGELAAFEAAVSYPRRYLCCGTISNKTGSRV